ncbi:MAG: sterol desaturase family protein [Chlorobiales bacterium]|jgi:sterol desaturase/sphingolipid hydroxylase (fatty acid hydroxylase superfamily)|nr:sterol desaturase family protein [Chlorobiales bacterium]
MEEFKHFLSTPQGISLLVIVGTALVYMVLERIFPYDRRQKVLRNGYFNDLVMYTLVQSYVLGIAIGWLIEWMDNQSGLSRLHLVSDWPVWGQLLFFTITHDLYIYGMHRWMHENKYLWRIHEAHHSVTDVDWLAGSRSHALEIMLNQTIEFAPIVLLGAAPEVAIYKGVIDAVWGMFIHANLDVRLGPLAYVINGPEQHRWHHAIDPPRGKVNYGTKLALWDTMFGTLTLFDHKPQGYGLANKKYPLSDSGAPLFQQVAMDFVNYFKQQAYAFRPMKAKRQVA